MAKTDDEEIMSAAEMKPLLMLSKREPVNCAIGLSKDKQALILFDKKAKPRKVFAMLKKQAAGKKIDLDMATVRFGTASVDPAVDSALVQFKVNKDAPGAMRPKLIAALKKAGFGKCEIIVDQGLEDEPDEEPEAGEPAAAAAAAPDGAGEPPAPAAASPEPAPTAAPTASGPADSSPAASSPADSSPADSSPAASSPAAPAEDGGADMGALTQRLTGLVKRMLGVLGSNPAGADAMKTAAMAAQTALKSGDAATAGGEADTLERLLDSAGPGGGAGAGGSKGGPAMGSPVFGKARATWVATRGKVESELEKLHDEMQSVYKGHGVVADLEKTFRSKIEPMMAAFDHSLSDKLDEVAKNADPGSHAKLVGEVKAIITKYESFLSSDPLIAKLDDNPFVPLSLEKTLTASLTALSKVVA